MFTLDIDGSLKTQLDSVQNDLGSNNGLTFSPDCQCIYEVFGDTNEDSGLDFGDLYIFTTFS